MGCWSHLDPVTSRLKGVGVGTYAPNGQYSLKDVVYQDAGIYKCVGQSPTNKKKLEVLNTIALGVKGKVDLTSFASSIAILILLEPQQVFRRSRREMKLRQPFLGCHFISLSSSAPIHRLMRRDGFMVTEFTRPVINTVQMF